MGELIEGIFEGLEGAGAEAMNVFTTISESVEKFKELGPVAEFIAAAFEKTGAQGEKIKSDWSQVVNNVLAIAAVFITQVEPLIDGVLKSVNNSIKEFAPALTEAIKEGKVEELLGDAFEAAVEHLGNLLFNPHFWIGLGEMAGSALDLALVGLGKVILNIGILLKTVLDKAFQDSFQVIGKIPGLGKALGISDYRAESFGQIYDGNQKGNAPANQFLDTVMAALRDTSAQGMQEFAKAIDESKNGPAQNKFDRLLHSLTATAAPAVTPINSGSVAPPHPDTGNQNHYHPEFTSLEKMGFIMGGANDPYHQRSLQMLTVIADATQKMVGIIEHSGHPTSSIFQLNINQP